MGRGFSSHVHDRFPHEEKKRNWAFRYRLPEAQSLNKSHRLALKPIPLVIELGYKA